MEIAEDSVTTGGHIEELSTGLRNLTEREERQQSFSVNHMYWILVDSVLFVLIVCGNVLTILAVRLSRRLRNVTSNYFVTNLAVSDFLVGLTLPYHLAFYLDESLGKLSITCILRFVLISFASCASIYNLIAVAIDRYIAIVHPLKYTRYMTKKVAVIMIAIGWIDAIAISTIPIYWNCFEASRNSCELDTVLPRYYTVAILTPILGLIWISMFLLYWRIWREARTHAHRLRLTGFYNAETSDWKSVQVVLLVMGCFSICWLPYLVVACTRAFDWHQKASPTLYKAMFSLAMANSGMNPMIYAWKNANFRKAFFRLLRFQSPNRNEFNSSLKNYLRKQNELPKLDRSNNQATINQERRHIRTISKDYSLGGTACFETTTL